MKNYRYINTGAVVTLLDLLDSADVDDAQDVAVFDEAGDFVCRCDGSWTAPYLDRTGVANKPGTGLTVKFRLTDAPMRATK